MGAGERLTFRSDSCTQVRLAAQIARMIMKWRKSAMYSFRDDYMMRAHPGSSVPWWKPIWSRLWVMERTGSASRLRS